MTACLALPHFIEMEKATGISAVGGSIESIARLMSSPGGRFSRVESNHYLEIVQVTGLNETTITIGNLQQYLKQLNLVTSFKGEIVL